MTAKTKNEIEIMHVSSGFTSGKLYVGNTSEEIDCVSIFDKETYNFHLCPQREYIREDISKKIKKTREEVVKYLVNSNLKGVEIGPDKNEKDVIYFKYDVEHLDRGIGSRGGCNEFGGLFRFISARKNGITYDLNFMRFFVDGDRLKRVNCILQSLQFDRCVNSYCNQSAKGDGDICYPFCFCSQTDAELERLLQRRCGQSFFFNPRVEFNDSAEKIAKEFVRFINISDSYGKNCIIKAELLSKNIDNRYIMKLNRYSDCLEIYERKDVSSLYDSYPIRKDFDVFGYIMYTLNKEIPCIYGGSGDTSTPSGIFRIEKVSRSEYISSYHPLYKEVKFFGYLAVFEDYFIHSDMYSVDVTNEDFRKKEPMSQQDKCTSGCIRITQECLDWLIENIPEGTMVEL